MSTDTVTTQIRAMVAQSDSKQLHQVADDIQSMTLREMSLARNTMNLLTKQAPAWLKGAQPGEVEAFARAATFLGLNPLTGEAYLIHSGFYVSLAGRRKLAQRTGDWDGENAPTMLTAAEEEIYGVKPGDIARKVEVWRKGVSRPAVGVGIVRKAEQKGPDYLPIVNAPEFMAAKRATANGYKVAFPDLDVAVVDLEQRGVRGYTVTTVEGEFAMLAEAEDEPGDTYDRPALAAPTAPPAAPSAPTDPPASREAAATASGRVPVLLSPEQAVAVGGADAWLEQYPAPEGVADAVAIAEAVAAELANGAPSEALAISQVHRTRAREGLSFNTDLIVAEDVPSASEQQDEPAAPQRGRRSATAEQPTLG